MSQATSQQLAMIRRETAKFLKDTCTLKRPVDARDEIGGSGNEFATVTTLACRILPLNDKGRDFQVGEGEQGRSYFRLIVPYDSDVRDGDQIEFGSDTYEVQQIEEVHTDNTDVRARLMRLG